MMNKPNKRKTSSMNFEEMDEILNEIRAEADLAIEKAFGEWMQKKVLSSGLPEEYVATPIAIALMYKGHELACAAFREDLDKDAADAAIGGLLDWHSNRLLERAFLKLNETLGKGGW